MEASLELEKYDSIVCHTLLGACSLDVDVSDCGVHEPHSWDEDICVFAQLARGS